MSNIINTKENKPKEIMIEIETRCNLDCGFCFNKNTFARKGRDIENKLTNGYIKKIIDSAVSFGVFALRFTGGEPLLRDDIWDLAEYARKKQVKLCLNTNGLLIKDIGIAKRISSLFENVLLPLQYEDFNRVDALAKKKVRAIKLLNRAGVSILRVGTVATKDLINNLEQFHEIIFNLKINDWELYRELSVGKEKIKFTKTNAKKLVEGLLSLNGRYGKSYKIANAIPFCVHDPRKVSQVALGAEAVDGHRRFAIDPRGFAKPFYYFEKNIGDPLDLKACWNNDFMKKMRKLEFLPKECAGCIYTDKCRGGCRFSSFTANNSYALPDPLMDIKNKVINKL